MKRLDIEEYFRALLCLEIMDSYSHLRRPLERVRQAVVVALGVLSFVDWNDSTLEGGDDSA